MPPVLLNHQGCWSCVTQATGQWQSQQQSPRSLPQGPQSPRGATDLGPVPACSRGHQAPSPLTCSALPSLNDAESLLRTFLLEGLSRKQLMQPLLLIHGTDVQRVIKPQAPFSLIPNYALTHKALSVISSGKLRACL